MVAQIEIETWGCNCWTWTGRTRRHGGGLRPVLAMRVPGGGRATPPKQYNVCRLMLQEINGSPIAPELEASHLCEDNWLCINPDHLIDETKRENLDRRNARKRLEPPEIFERGIISNICPF